MKKSVKHTGTRGDYIRSMSDEQLATVMLQMAGLDETIRFCKNLKECGDQLDETGEVPESRCKQCLMEWLKEKVKEGDGIG